MAAGAAGASQGAAPEHLDEGQGTAGAPKAPELNGIGGDGVVPKDDPAKAAAEKAAADKAAAEAAAKAAEDGADEDEEEDDKPVLTEWADFEDPSANAAVDLLKEAGVSPAEADKIFAKAIESNDLRDINVAELEAKVGKTKALLIMNGVKDYYQRTVEQNSAVVSMVHETFGGEAGWNTVKQWAQAKERNDAAFKKELDSIREDLDKGGRAAKTAAKDLLKMYNGAPNTKGLGNTAGKLTKGEGKPAPVGEPLTRADYLTALKKAHAEGANPTAIADLDRRRMAGKKAGI